MRKKIAFLENFAFHHIVFPVFITCHIFIYMAINSLVNIYYGLCASQKCKKSVMCLITSLLLALNLGHSCGGTQNSRIGWCCMFVSEPEIDLHLSWKQLICEYMLQQNYNILYYNWWDFSYSSNIPKFFSFIFYIYCNVKCEYSCNIMMIATK